MYSNNILNFQESTRILNACTKSLEAYWGHHVSYSNIEKEALAIVWSIEKAQNFLLGKKFL